WRKAYQRYYLAFQATGGYWTGINAATSSLILGDRDSALRLAASDREICLKETAKLSKDHPDWYWLMATLAEAALIHQDWPEAVLFYSEAAGRIGSRFGVFGSSDRNACLVLTALNDEIEITWR
ncbi:MAG: hypothetical protein HQK55_15740, partial [Deltaproteobacteria bacterium]|nr:hypothetical protein [Deltaproteobacteria bacterium]